MVQIGDPWADAPEPKRDWVSMTDWQRVEEIAAQLAHLSADVSVISATRSGVVTLALDNSLNAKQRGTLLRRIEAALKEYVDESIIVYLQPQGDRNRLRRLRGVEVAE